MTDLELRIFAPTGDVYPVEAEINDSGSFRGKVQFDFVALARETNPFAYGRALRDALFQSPKLQQAFLQAMATGVCRCRVLVDADAGEATTIMWERLMLKFGDEDRPAAASPQTPLSRYLALELQEPKPLTNHQFRLLLAIASPSDLKQLTPINTEEEIESLVSALTNLIWMGELRLTILTGHAKVSAKFKESYPDCEFVEEATTLDRLNRILADQDGLHIIAHGNLTRDRKALLILEKEDGTIGLADEEVLADKLNLPNLRFVFLHSCKGTGGGAQVGLGPRLVRNGVPAVIAMQDFVPMGDARQFATAFYGSLMRDGAVDVAANAGRQAILRSDSQNWLIPVLFSRLRSGRIWETDPLRSVTRRLGDEFRKHPSVTNPFPVEAIMVRSGISTLQHGTEMVTGPRLSLIEGSLGTLQNQTPFTLLIGNRGRAKSGHLKRLFVECSDRSLKEMFPEPVHFSMRHMLPTAATPARTLAQATVRSLADHGLELDVADAQFAIEHRDLLFLIDDDDVGPDERREALEVLENVMSRKERAHRFYVTVDESTLDANLYPDESIALVIQLMTPAQVDGYLDNPKQEESVRKLGISLRRTGLYDLASVPWLLSGLIEDARCGIPLQSRSGALARFVRDGLSRVAGTGGIRTRTEDALARMAWHMQMTRKVDLSGSELYALLAQVRGNREFRLDDFLTQILNSQLMVKNGEEGTRFAYPGLQSYYCARYLVTEVSAQERDRQLEDITATLGRQSRVRWWEDTLAILAGMMDSPDTLLRKLLAGSQLTEGEQVFLATRCLHEARCANRYSKGSVGQDVVDQIVDTLIWRAHPNNVHQVSARHKALEAMGTLGEHRVIPFLVSVAIQRIRRDWENKPCFDYSSVRQKAVMALIGMQEEAFEFVKTDPVLSKNEPLLSLLHAWLKQDVRKLSDFLDMDDPVLAPVAAIALGTIQTSESLDLLILRFCGLSGRERNVDIFWAVTDTLCIMDPVEVNNRAVKPMLDQPEMASQVAYLIGKLGLASLRSPEHRFLERCLKSGDAYLQGRALQSAATLLSLHRENSESRALMADVRELCHHLALDDFEAAAEHTLISLLPNMKGKDRWQLRYQALEALRALGDESSIDILRQVRRQFEMGREPSAGPPLSQLSFEISEEIYWRLTGGLSAETYLPLKARPKTDPE